MHSLKKASRQLPHWHNGQSTHGGPAPLLTSSSSKTLCSSASVNWKTAKGESSCTRPGSASESTHQSSAYIRCIKSAKRLQMSSGPDAKRPSKCITDATVSKHASSSNPHNQKRSSGRFWSPFQYQKRWSSYTRQCISWYSSLSEINFPRNCSHSQWSIVSSSRQELFHGKKNLSTFRVSS
jgi:hypothetical protein